MRLKYGKFLLVLLAVAVAFAGGAVWWTAERPASASATPPAWRTLASLNNEMIRAHDGGDWTNAARIAAKILSQPAWRTFVPANAVMGSALAREGQYQAAAAFFKAALSGKGIAAPQPAVMNDYADTLRHLRRYAEAESYARRAIVASGGQVPLFRRTLEEILRDVGTVPASNRPKTAKKGKS